MPPEEAGAHRRETYNMSRLRSSSMEIKEKGTEVLREQLDAAQKVPHILFYSILFCTKNHFSVSLYVLQISYWVLLRNSSPRNENLLKYTHPQVIQDVDQFVLPQIRSGEIYIYIYAFSRRFYTKQLTGYTFFLYVCSLGIEPTTFCAANSMLYHWATGTVALHHLLSNGWMGAVRMRVQTADKNITIIHTTPVHQLTSACFSANVHFWVNCCLFNRLSWWNRFYSDLFYRLICVFRSWSWKARSVTDCLTSGISWSWNWRNWPPVYLRWAGLMWHHHWQ